MSKKPTPPKRDNTVREPAQVYLGADDSALLLRLSMDTGLPKAEILRRGIRSFAREQLGSGPMMEFLADSTAAVWTEQIAANHDEVLAAEYRGDSSKSGA